MTPDDEDQFGSPAYVRRLRRYEAAPVASASAAGMDFYSPFGPMISRVRAPVALVDGLNSYADGLIAAAGAGNRGPGEITLPEDFVRAGGEDSLASSTARWMAQYLETADDRAIGKVRFESFWMVRHFAGTFSPAHFHSGDVSGVLYLKVPDQIENEREEEQQSYINARRAGYITFLIGGKQRYSKSVISFKPRVGDFYIFPGWLLHAVEPFLGEGERRAMSFNAFVE
ncbi:MAG: hypothetical protein IH604_21010 [Burkholderiales bacterium]|nr:hypothetical protein [Burkholderiales bacterium]